MSQPRYGGPSAKRGSIRAPTRPGGRRAGAPRSAHHHDGGLMKARTLLIAVGVGTAIALVMASSPAMAQSTDGSSLRRIEPVKTDSSPDFAKARADAEAKARQNTDVSNKQNQKQTAVGLGIGGGASVDVKNKISSTNVNVNSLKTGDTTNINANSNKQIQSFGVPILTPV